MKLKLLFSLFFFASYTLIAQDIPEPYNSIVDLPFDPHGWFGNAGQLKGLIAQKKPKVIIEIGSWLGASTRFLAQNVEDGGSVYAVDTWAGSSEIALKDPRLPFLYQLFLSNVKHAGLAHKIIPIRMKSLEAAKALTIKADLIYIDGAHDTNSVRNDILAWQPHLNPGGILCGDDWKWETVRKAVVECSNILGKKIEAIDNFWYYRD